MPYKNKADQRESHRRWHLKNRTTILKKQREYREKIKDIVLSHYGEDHPKCECCGEKIKEFLCIDHIEGGGTKHRKQIGRGYLYFWLIKNGFPKGFRILCHNCNQAISYWGKCPHKDT
jgi:hypothetical protein